MSTIKSYEIKIEGTNKIVESSNNTELILKETKFVDVANKVSHSVRDLNGKKSENYMLDNAAYDFIDNRWNKQIVPEEQFNMMFSYPDTKVNSIKNENNLEIIEDADGYLIKNKEVMTMSEYIAIFESSDQGELPEEIEDTTEVKFEFRINKDFTTKSIKMDLVEKQTGSTMNSLHSFDKYNSVEAIKVPEEALKATNNR